MPSTTNFPGELPADCKLLPLGQGQLLVSRGHAVFCRVPAAQQEPMRGVLKRQQPLSSLEPELLAELERHGFFGEPREPEVDPPSVQLQLTNACNLVCTYCCTNSGAARGQELTLELARRAVDQAHDELGPGVRIAVLGGEPLLVPWALDLVQYVVDRELDMTLFTNALPLAEDDALAARLAALCRRGAEVRVSLAGATAEHCDQESGTSRFDAAIAGIGRVAAHGGEVVVDLMLMPQHVQGVAGHLHALKQRLPEGTRVALGLCYLSGREEGERIFGSRGELEQALDRIAFEAGEVITAPQRSPVTHRREGCTCAMGNHLHLRSDGALFTCFKMEEQVGDLAAEESFAEAINRVRSEPHPAAVLPRCADCALATLCGGGCRSDNLLYTGDADDPLCDTWRVRVVCELLAEDQVSVVDWPIPHLLAEAHQRGIEAPAEILPVKRSRHLKDT